MQIPGIDDTLPGSQILLLSFGFLSLLLFTMAFILSKAKPQ